MTHAKTTPEARPTATPPHADPFRELHRRLSGCSMWDHTLDPAREALGALGLSIEANEFDDSTMTFSIDDEPVARIVPLDATVEPGSTFDALDLQIDPALELRRRVLGSRRLASELSGRLGIHIEAEPFNLINLTLLVDDQPAARVVSMRGEAAAAVERPVDQLVGPLQGIRGLHRRLTGCSFWDPSRGALHRALSALGIGLDFDGDDVYSMVLTVNGEPAATVAPFDPLFGGQALGCADPAYVLRQRIDGVSRPAAASDLRAGLSGLGLRFRFLPAHCETMSARLAIELDGQLAGLVVSLGSAASPADGAPEAAAAGPPTAVDSLLDLRLRLTGDEAIFGHAGYAIREDIKDALAAAGIRYDQSADGSRDAFVVDGKIVGRIAPVDDQQARGIEPDGALRFAALTDLLATRDAEINTLDLALHRIRRAIDADPDVDLVEDLPEAVETFVESARGCLEGADNSAMALRKIGDIVCLPSTWSGRDLAEGLPAAVETWIGAKSSGQPSDHEAQQARALNRIGSAIGADLASNAITELPAAVERFVADAKAPQHEANAMALMEIAETVGLPIGSSIARGLPAEIKRRLGEAPAAPRRVTASESMGDLTRKLDVDLLPDATTAECLDTATALQWLLVHGEYDEPAGAVPGATDDDDPADRRQVIASAFLGALWGAREERELVGVEMSNHGLAISATRQGGNESEFFECEEVDTMLLDEVPGHVAELLRRARGEG